MALLKKDGDFIDNLPRIYGFYTGGFLIFIILMAILEQFGVSADTIGILFVAFTVVIYASHWLALPDHPGRRLLCRRAPGAEGV